MAEPEKLDPVAPHVEDIYGQLFVYTLDPSVTDADRSAAGVRTLAEVVAEAKVENLRRARDAATRSDMADGTVIERVWRDPSPADLAARLGEAPHHLWIDGNELVLLCRSSAREVLVGGGFEMPLWRVGDSDLWEVTVRIRGLERAVLSLRLMECEEPGNHGEHTHRATLKWRGPEAPSAVAVEAPLEAHTFRSRALGSERVITVQLPERKPEAVVFAADGWLRAGPLRVLEGQGLVRPTAVIGTESAAREGSIARAWEYSYGRNPARFDAHREFFVREVPAWVEERYAIGADRLTTVVFGCSTGGRFAADMGVLEPERYGACISLSSFGEMAVEPKWVNSPPPRYALGAGTLEDAERKTEALAIRLRGLGVPAHYEEWVGGHDPDAWDETFPRLLQWALEGG